MGRRWFWRRQAVGIICRDPSLPLCLHAILHSEDANDDVVAEPAVPAPGGSARVWACLPGVAGFDVAGALYTLRLDGTTH
jgi:hypothetical protein